MKYLQILLFLLLASPVAVAGEESQASTTVLRDDANWLVTLNEYPPGTAGPEHTHEGGRLVYVLAGGTVVLTGADGSSVEVPLETGQLVERPPETHTVRNSGTSTVRLLETEARHAGKP